MAHSLPDPGSCAHGTPLTQPHPSLTAPGIIKGKLAYIAPEIARGKPASAQSDLFSMGCVLWEGLAGRPLYFELRTARCVLVARELEVWTWRSRGIQFGRFEKSFSPSAYKINVQPIPSILGNLPDAKSGMLDPIFLFPIHTRLLSTCAISGRPISRSAT